MLLFSYLLAAPMVAAGLLHNKPVCGTTTRTCTE
jgi:hypothetical protein